MEYKAVGNRCAVIIESLRLPISREETLAILCAKGFRLVGIDLIELARQCIEKSQYRRGARLSEAPGVVDCSSFVKWLYGKRGIWLPRRSIQQSECGEAVNPNAIIAGDLIFKSGRIDFYYDDPACGIGHVGIATGEGSVIHAKNSKVNIVESDFRIFTGKDKFRGVRRYIPKGAEVLTFETPIDKEVEIAEDVRWIVLQELSKEGT